MRINCNHLSSRSCTVFTPEIYDVSAPFSCQHIVPSSIIIEEIPASRIAYRDTDLFSTSSWYKDTDTSTAEGREAPKRIYSRITILKEASDACI